LGESYIRRHTVSGSTRTLTLRLTTSYVCINNRAILQSFCPLGGIVRSVAIYLSDYGSQSLMDEAVNGPPRLIWKKSTSAIGTKPLKKRKPQMIRAQGSVESDSGETGDSDASEEEERVDIDYSSQGEQQSDSVEESDEEEDIRLMDVKDLEEDSSENVKDKGGDFVRPSGSAGIVFDIDDDNDEEEEGEGEGGLGDTGRESNQNNK
jgi:hypothetical protein